MSFDGLVARPGRFGAGGWGVAPEDPALKERKLGGMHDVGLHLMGRNTYEEMAEFCQGFTGTFADDTIGGRWESSSDGTNWSPDFALTYTRVK